MNAWRPRISTLRTAVTTTPVQGPWAASAVLLAAVAVGIAGCGGDPASPGVAGPAAPPASNGALEHALEHADPLYRCPMHPEVVSDQPGTCPVCGMDLVKVAEEPAETDDRTPIYYRHPHDPNRTSPVPQKDEMGMDYVAVYADAAGPEVRISPAVVNNLGVRTAIAARETLALRAETVGYVSYDERRLQQVRPRAEGWIEGLSVRAVGETVRAGERLFTVYSPTLEAAQQEYLDALGIGNADLIEASRERLRALGLDAGTASRLAKAGRASGRVPFHAPISGVVTELEAREGAMLTPDMIAMTITELASLWVIAEVPESQAAWVRAGTAAELGFPSLPGETVRGRVEYVYPEISMDTRTVRARITLEQPPAAIRPNMLATVVLVGERGADALTIPRSALIRTGADSRVVIARDGGRFVPRRVVAGAEVGDRVVIRDGLAEGERVVVAGQFLLDSEANMRAGLERLGSDGAEPAGEAKDPGTADVGEPAPPEHRH